MNKLPIIQKGYQGGIDFQDDHKVNHSLFLYLYFGAIITFFIIVILRLFHLTIVKGEYYRGLADGNRIREVVIEPKRGTILDRKGIVVAQNIKADVQAQEGRLLSLRYYTEAEAIAPLIGYRQVADNTDIKNDPCLSKIKAGDKIGKKGVEKIYECDLRGQNGKKLVEIDARGKSYHSVAIVPPIDGRTIKLALDLELQKKAYELVKDKRASIVVLKPQTGELLVLISTPSFNPHNFEEGNAQKTLQYFNNKDKPLFNRATEGAYPPGSIFKIILAAGSLEDKVIDEKTLVEDTGRIKAGPIEFGNWYFLQYGKTEGEVNIVKALRRSNDIYFYKLGEKMGVDKIKSWSEKFGYGRKTGIELDETEGLIPGSFWKEENLKEQWYLGDTYNLSIGQGYILTTPLQVTQATSIIANGGYLCRPQLLKGGSDCKKLPLSKKTLELVTQGMVEACTPGGTGWPLFDFSVDGKKIPVACKTGTAESHADSKITHAWFTAFAPVNLPAGEPEIVLTVLVEEGGQGSDVAAPIAKDILKAYFERSF